MTHLARALEKQPSESRVYELDFTELLAAGDSVASVTSLTATPAGLTVGAATVASPKVQFRLSAGADKTRYKITAVIVTAAGDTLEGEGELQVKDL